MTPKKAIIIVLVLFLIMIMVFTFLYLKKQLAVPGDNSYINTSASSTGGINKNSPLNPAEVVQQKIDKIIKEVEKNPAQNTPDKVRQDIIGTINAEIIKQEQNKTSEQKAADLKAQEERQKMINQINSQIK